MALVSDQLSQRDIVIIVIYKSLSDKGMCSPSSILKENAICESLSRTYFYDLCRELKDKGYLNVVGNKYRIYYEINSKGKEHYEWYKKQYREQFEEVKKVVDRIAKDLTGTGVISPVEKELPVEYRLFFSKVVSVKDIIRYMILKHLQKGRSKILLSEVEEEMRQAYGWSPSSSYLYDIGYELYEEGLVKTWWKDDKRSIRYYKITDRGVHHFQQIANSTLERSLSLQHFMADVLKLF